MNDHPFIICVCLKFGFEGPVSFSQETVPTIQQFPHTHTQTSLALLVYEDPLHAKRSGNGTGVLPARTAETRQDMLGRVVTFGL